MANEIKDTSSTEISTDIYKIAEFVESIKAKYVDVPEETLVLGVYGFLSSMFINLIENTTTMAAEYAYEAIPSKAKFERNIIGHALSFGIDKIFATPAELDIILGISEESLIPLLVNNQYTLDKDTIFTINSNNKSYTYLLDYSITIKRDVLPTGQGYGYTAKYNIDGTNALATMINPYLPAIESANLADGSAILLLKTTIRQMVHTTIYKKILLDNPLENKVLTFEFSDQLAFFYVEVEEDGITYYLKPIYDGLAGIYNDDDTEYYINYIFLDSKNIRLTFNRESYQPRRNANVTIHIYTTSGSEANFEISNYQSVQNIGRLYVMIQNMSDSSHGSDRLTIKQLKAAIPKEMVSRGVVTTYQDLNNLFNAMQTEDCKLYFLEKLHNQINRLFYSYILLKDGSNVIPTNTIDVNIDGSVISSSSSNSYIIRPGSVYYTDPNTRKTVGMSSLTSEEIDKYDQSGFLYTCPYLMVINKSPMYVGYYLTLVDYSRYLYFEYINEESKLQFISVSFHIVRDYYHDSDTYKINVKLTQNVSMDFNLISYDDNSKVNANIKVFMVVYTTNANDEDVAARYAEANLIEYNESEWSYTYQFKLTTNDQISNNNQLMITSGFRNINSTLDSTYSISSNIKIKLFYLAQLDTQPVKGRIYGDNLQLNLDNIIPGLDAYTLTNVYNAGDSGIDVYYDYSNINYSYIEMDRSSSNINMNIYRVPVVGYKYLINELYEDRIRNFLNKVDVRKRYIENKLSLLENSFGIDYKFFNTYGPSYMYNINNQSNLDRINLSLLFEVKFQTPAEKAYLSQITTSIKEYIEDLNYITDLHMSNLITHLTNLYREHLIYIKFIKLNNYGSLYQSIYKNPVIDQDYFEETQAVPEFINVKTFPDTGLPDIEFRVVE